MSLNLNQKNVLGAFLFSLFLTLCFPVLFPTYHLIFFSPFLIILFYQSSYLACLWSALLCGIIIDLLSSDMRLGLYGIIFCLTTALLYNQKRNFFADSLSTLPIMTYLFSLIFTIIQALSLYILEKESILSWKWILTDLVFMPGLDALYAFIVFILPAIFFGKMPRRGKDYFRD